MTCIYQTAGVCWINRNKYELVSYCLDLVVQELDKLFWDERFFMRRVGTDKPRFICDGSCKETDHVDVGISLCFAMCFR